MKQTEHILTHLNIFLHIIYLLELYLYTYFSVFFNFLRYMGEGWDGMLSSSKDGIYRMCLARRKCDRLQNDKNCPALYILFVSC